MKQIVNQKFAKYNAIFEEEKEGGFSVWVPDLPGCTSQGETIEEAIANIKEAISLYLEDNKSVVQNYSKYQFTFPITTSLHA